LSFKDGRNVKKCAVVRTQPLLLPQFLVQCSRCPVLCPRMGLY